MRVPLLNFEGGPGVPLLNFSAVPGPEYQGPEYQGPEVPVLVLLLQHACISLLYSISDIIKNNKL